MANGKAPCSCSILQSQFQHIWIDCARHNVSYWNTSQICSPVANCATVVYLIFFLMGWSKTLFRICLLWWPWLHNVQILGSLAYFCWQECIFHLSSLLFFFWPLAHPRSICLPPFSWLWFHQLVLIVKNSQEVGLCILALMKEKGKQEETCTGKVQ